jgi:hypothetical protein
MRNNAQASENEANLFDQRERERERERERVFHEINSKSVLISTNGIRIEHYLQEKLTEYV